MTFTCLYFLLKSDGGMNEKGEGTLRYAFLNRHAPNTTTHLHYLIFSLSWSRWPGWKKNNAWLGCLSGRKICWLGRGRGKSTATIIQRGILSGLQIQWHQILTRPEWVLEPKFSSSADVLEKKCRKLHFTLLSLFVNELIAWCKLEWFRPLRKTVSPHRKNYDNFSCVFEIANQLLTRHSLYLAPWVNGNSFAFWNVI